jgi:hypothetical protein
MDIPSLRLHNQQLTSQIYEKPEDVVRWFGAIQAQDFAAAKWAIALRTSKQTDESIEKAFNEGRILRTHIMRPTWHFVVPEDIRWILALTSTRVHRFNGYYYRRTGLDKSIFEKSNAVIRKALGGNRQLTRSDLDEKLKNANIPTENLGLSYTIMQAELDGIICSGPRQGKQFTYMLLDERAPQTKEKTTDEALVELTKRYFQSHGPAQEKDFSWWSGLTLTDARKAVLLSGVALQKEEREQRTYYFCGSKPKNTSESVILVPGFDEYFIAYTNRVDVLEKKYVKELNQGGGMVSGAVVVNGKMVGGWRRTFEKKSVIVRIRLFEKISERAQQLLEQQTKRFGKFLNMPVEIKQIFSTP